MLLCTPAITGVGQMYPMALMLLVLTVAFLMNAEVSLMYVSQRP